MSNIFSNITGTTSDKFSIGKRGTSVISGNIAPNNNIGSDGDLYVLKAASPKIYQKKTNNWVEIGTKHIQTITSSDTILCSFPEEVIFCNMSEPIDITLDTTFSGVGYTVTIKDISNSASTNTITVNGYGVELFDNNQSVVVSTNMGSIQLLFDGSNFWLI
jgi:hypothetical protein